MKKIIIFFIAPVFILSNIGYALQDSVYTKTNLRKPLMFSEESHLDQLEAPEALPSVYEWFWRTAYWKVLFGDEELIQTARFLKEGQDPQELEREAQIIVELRNKGLHLPVPIPHKSGSYTYPIKGQVEGVPRGLYLSPSNRVFSSLAVLKDFEYFNTKLPDEMAYDEKVRIIENSALLLAGEIVKLVEAGYVHTALSPVMHNPQGSNKWLHDHGPFPARWITNVAKWLHAPNMSRISLRDVEHVQPINSFRYVPHDVASMLIELTLCIVHAGYVNGIQNEDIKSIGIKTMDFCYHKLMSTQDNFIVSNPDSYDGLDYLLSYFIKELVDHFDFVAEFPLSRDEVKFTAIGFLINLGREIDKWHRNDWPSYEEFLTGKNGLVEPKAITITEDGLVLVLDGNQVKVFDEQKDLVKIYGKLDGEAGKDQGEFNSPSDIAFDSLGRLWVIDAGNHRAQILDKKGQYLFEIGSYGSLPGQFNSPSRIAIQGERAYVLDSGNYRIQIFAVDDGNFLGSFGIRGQDRGQFEEPTSIAIDDEGRVYVGDRGHQNHILQFDANGNFLDLIGYRLVSPTERLGKFTFGPDALVIRDGKVYAADGGDRILVFSLDGSYEYEFGTNGSRVGRFNNVIYLKFDKHGRLYVLEDTQRITEAFSDRDFTRGQRIQRITPPVGIENVTERVQRSKAERDL